MSQVHLSTFFQLFKKSLTTLYSSDEAEAITRLVAEETTGLTYTQIRFSNELLSPALFEKLTEISTSLLMHEPVQYVLGFADFCGLRFTVNQSTLIPRPETELLVNIIVDESIKYNHPLTILDVGTGSGCIAISVKSKLKNAVLFATDISEEALTIARLNAKSLYQEVSFINHDILAAPSLICTGMFDMIVSNPPYILPDEQSEMKENVWMHEPHSALFVTNNNPLQFYTALLEQSKVNLKLGGVLAVEINQQFGSNVVEVFELFGYKNIELVKDQFNNPRIVKGVK